jgi:hypothetical protein
MAMTNDTPARTPSGNAPAEVVQTLTRILSDVLDKEVTGERLWPDNVAGYVEALWWRANRVHKLLTHPADRDDPKEADAEWNELLDMLRTAPGTLSRAVAEQQAKLAADRPRRERIALK